MSDDRFKTDTRPADPRDWVMPCAPVEWLGGKPASCICEHSDTDHEPAYMPDAGCRICREKGVAACAWDE